MMHRKKITGKDLKPGMIISDPGWNFAKYILLLQKVEAVGNLFSIWRLLVIDYEGKCQVLQCSWSLDEKFWALDKREESNEAGI